MAGSATTTALFSHLLAQTRSNITFLISHNQISAETAPNDARDLEYNPDPGRAIAKRKLCGGTMKADPQDLSFRPGDIIEIVQETNKDWWTGRHNGCEGLFPSNYVEKLPPSTTQSSNQSSFLNRSPSRHNPPQPAPTIPRLTHRTLRPQGPGSYGPPPPSGPPGHYGPPGPPGPPPGGYYQQPPYPYQSPPPPGPMQYQPPIIAQSASAPPAPLPADPPKKNRFGGMGNTLATAAVGGLGFGAGSAIGSDVVNSIF
ncbi:hypothetical protein BT96DRAFT_1003354 [Gymnopus androsaceus JB14]|uniref:SH3 domain-containing protein n=1 Tax=Gymnopus androsaceus JB14 TaxID=1447944 RepID=A0A6A4GV78_9AGAR|nr:hypothetical protein BT96DRAFT_1003354 [Gymnopus androsaceus JB14]